MNDSHALWKGKYGTKSYYKMEQNWEMNRFFDKNKINKSICIIFIELKRQNKAREVTDKTVYGKTSMKCLIFQSIWKTWKKIKEGIKRKKSVAPSHRAKTVAHLICCRDQPFTLCIIPCVHIWRKNYQSVIRLTDASTTTTTTTTKLSSMCSRCQFTQ